MELSSGNIWGPNHVWSCFQKTGRFIFGPICPYLVPVGPYSFARARFCRRPFLHTVSKKGELPGEFGMETFKALLEKTPAGCGTRTEPLRMLIFGTLL